MLQTSAAILRALLLQGFHTLAPIKEDVMSSILHPKSIARNLARVSGSGYRVNIELGEAGERARQANVAISRFQAGVTGAGITLSRLADQGHKRSSVTAARKAPDIAPPSIFNP
jgi:hypothetical protein